MNNVTVFDLSTAKVVSVLVGAVPAGATLYEYLRNTIPVCEIMIISVISFGVLISFIAWLKIGELNIELNAWCANLEPEHYPMQNPQAAYVYKAKYNYKKWLRKNLFIPNPERREKMFHVFVQSLKSKPGVVKIQENFHKVERERP